MASKIFWITHSVYTRAVPDKHANILLEMLDSQNAHGFDWHKNDDFMFVWSQMYNYVLDY